MKNRTTWYVGFSSILALVAGVSLQAQTGDQGKPPVYTYISEWAVPRAQWADMVKLDEQDRPLMDKVIIPLTNDTHWHILSS